MSTSAVLCCLVLSVALAASAADLEKQWTVDREGPPRDATFGPGAVLADSYSGELTAASPLWDRGYGCSVSPKCAATCLDSSTNGEYYEVIPIQVTAVENLECAVTASTITDTMIFVYCDPFDPTQPLTNVVANDDDDGAGNWSAFLAADGVQLQPGQTCYLVVTTYGSAVTGTSTVDFTSATVHVVPVELQSFDVE